jgi:hypothetical protein
MISNFFPENPAVHKIMWKNIVQPGRPQMKIWRMRIACWIPKATNTHSVHVILIIFHCNSGCMNARQCYVMRTLPVLFAFHFIYPFERKNLHKSHGQEFVLLRVISIRPVSHILILPNRIFSKFFTINSHIH